MSELFVTFLPLLFLVMTFHLSSIFSISSLMGFVLGLGVTGVGLSWVTAPIHLPVLGAVPPPRLKELGCPQDIAGLKGACVWE